MIYLLFLITQNKWTKTFYEKTILENLTKNNCIKIKARKLPDNFVRVTNSSAINKTAEKGVNSFIDTYFKDNVLKESVGDENRAAIICKLFDWKIGCKIDDESGYLVLIR